MSLNDTFTSTGHKFFAHQEAMTRLRHGRGQPITTHVMLTDVCNHSCAFCSVQARAGDALPFSDVMKYLHTLQRYGLKSVILSGGGNPILYRSPNSKHNINDIVYAIHKMGLEIGLITNGMPLRKFDGMWSYGNDTFGFRESWKTVDPRTLDKLTWVRISMSGLDHQEEEVYVPDIDPSKTTLGFSYVFHDEFTDPDEPHHGKVSRPLDLVGAPTKVRRATDRLKELTSQIAHYSVWYNPRYVRLLPNCLEVDKIEGRCNQLRGMANEINKITGREVAFVQYKPPKPPNVCLLGSAHPVLNCDGYVYPCDSCVLNEAAGHKFGETWRICHWSEIDKFYDGDLPRSLIKDPSKQCPGCVFTRSNEILEGIRNGTTPIVPLNMVPEHANFI